MNQDEYAALIEIKKLKQNDSGRPSDSSTTAPHQGRHSSRQFLFGNGHILQATHAQYLRSKQPTLIHCGRMPNAPGNEPTDPEARRRWNKKANTFTAHMLVIHRPEIDLYERGQENILTYNWDSLQEFI